MIAVFAITDRTDRENNMHIRILLAEDMDSLLQIVGTLIYRKFLLIEQASGPFLAIIDNLARFLQPIDVIGAQGEENGLCSRHTFNCVEDGGRIVHHAERVHHSAELLLLEALANLIGKARAHEEHLFARTYLKVRLLNIDNRPKLHNPKL